MVQDMDIDKEDVQNYEEEKSELQLLIDDYMEYLLDRFLELQAKCKEDGFLWFDTTEFSDFYCMALNTSTGPPRKKRV